jgi:hypothetical protein
LVLSFEYYNSFQDQFSINFLKTILNLTISHFSQADTRIDKQPKFIKKNSKLERSSIKATTTFYNGRRPTTTMRKRR